MAQVPLADFLRDLGDALEQEIDSLVRLARRSAAVNVRREADGIRLSVEISTTADGVILSSEVQDRLRRELTEALAGLSEEAADRASLSDRLAGAERKAAAGDAALKRLKSRLKQLQKASESAAEPNVLSRRLEELQTEVAQERLARAAVEASLTILEHEREAAFTELADTRASRQTLEAELDDALRLIDDLRTELADVWDLLREARPGDAMAITLSATEIDRREGVERVQAKIIDARQLFKRRRGHRWPIAI
jgi:chromosome segregation ATPase